MNVRTAATGFLTALAATAALAQPAPPVPAGPVSADAIVQREMASSKAYDVLEYLADDIGPRISGSEGAAAAVSWATDQFRKWGIDVHTEPVRVPHWVRGVETGSLPSHHDQKIVLTALGGSIATPDEGITAEVVEVHNYDELKALGRDKVAGKIVLYDVPMNMEQVHHGESFLAYRDAVVYRGSGASRAADLGAVASLIRSVASASLRTPHTGAMRYDAKVPTKIPAAAITTEDAGLLHRLLSKGETVRMHLVLTPRMLPDADSFNVVAEIKGSERPDEIVLIGGHLDSWDLGTGAIDDGSGVAMVMETMRLLKELNAKPKRTIRCVLFMNEENGLAGGRAYAEAHKGELAKHVAAVETDAGVAQPGAFQTTLDGDALAALRKDVGALTAANANTLTTEKETGADTSPLIAAGVPGFGFAPNGLHYFDYHHTPADTLDKVDPKDLTANSAAIAAMTWVLAQR